LTILQTEILDSIDVDRTDVVVVDEADDALPVPPLRARVDWVKQTVDARSRVPSLGHPLGVSSVTTFDDLNRPLGSFIPAPVERDLRVDVSMHFARLPPVVRRALTLRVCCVGAESTGKSTLVSTLAKKYQSVSIGEFGRDYTLMKKAAGTNDSWTTDDFVHIANEQQRLEDLSAEDADAVLFCDTDAMSTDLWHERYLGARDLEVGRIAEARRYDLFVLCDIDIPWQADEIRLGANTRAAMHQRFLDVLASRPEPTILVSGTVEQRMQLVDDSLRAMRNNETIFARTRWHDLRGNYYSR
jgi:nicotinamide riboside kinase